MPAVRRTVQKKVRGGAGLRLPQVGERRSTSNCEASQLGFEPFAAGPAFMARRHPSTIGGPSLSNPLRSKDMRKLLVAAAIMAGLGATAAHAATMTITDGAN